MAYTFAGRYSEVFLDRFGNGLASMPVTVYEADGVTLSTLFTNRTKTAGTNPIATDARGNLSFFATPGTYKLVATHNGLAQSAIEVSVGPDGQDVSDAAADLALLNVEVDTKITGIGTTKVYTQATAPVSPVDGDMWYDTAGVVVQPNLDDLTDVNAPTPTDAHVLTWNAATSKWISAASAGGGGAALTPATTVTSETTFGIAAAVGVGTQQARQDHTHGTPTNPVTAHEAAADPHPTYLTAAEGTAAYEPSGTTATHAAAADPHAGYVKSTTTETVYVQAADPGGADGDLWYDTDESPVSGTSLFVAKSLYDANTILIATVDDTPVALPVAISTVLGRKATGDIDDLTVADLRTVVGRAVGAKYYLNTSEHAPMTTKDGSSQTQTASYAQQTVWWPCYTDIPIRITAVKTYCWTGEASAFLRVGVYADDGTVAPGALITDLGSLLGPSAGMKTLTSTSGTIPPGFFFLGVWSSNHATVRWNRATFLGTGPYGTITNASGRTLFGFNRSTVTDYSAGMPASAAGLPTSLASDATHSNAPLMNYNAEVV